MPLSFYGLGSRPVMFFIRLTYTADAFQLIMVNCSQLSQQMHLLLTNHLHMNGMHLGPDKLLDKLFVISVIINVLWQLHVSTSD